MYATTRAAVSRAPLPQGDAGTRLTLAHMQRLVDQGAKSLPVRERAVAVLRAARVRAHDHAGELGALFNYVRDGIRFTDDPVGIEMLQGAPYTMGSGAGDCDDRAILLASLARSVGIPVDLRLKAVAVNPARPRSFSHVYVVARDRSGRALALDPTYHRNVPGWEYPNPFRSLEVPV